MKNALKLVNTVLNDLVKLRMPATAAATVALIISVADPLGLHIKQSVVLAVIVGVGVIAQYIAHLRDATDPKVGPKVK